MYIQKNYLQNLNVYLQKLNIYLQRLIEYLQKLNVYIYKSFPNIRKREGWRIFSTPTANFDSKLISHILIISSFYLLTQTFDFSSKARKSQLKV